MTLNKNSFFDKARQRIKNKFRNRPNYKDEDIQRLERSELWYIDCYEQEASKNIKNAILYRLKALWESLSNNEQSCLFAIAIIFGILTFPLLLNIGKVSFSFVVMYISKLSLYALIALSVGFLYSLIKNRKITKSYTIYILWCVFFLLAIPCVPKLLGYGTTQIGDFYEYSTYIEDYYVYMSREPETVSDRKVYTLPAEIERREYYHGTTEIKEDYYGQPHGGNEIFELNYHINYLYFPNGGYLYFDYDEAYENPEYSILKLNSETKVTDYHGDTYYITLTKNKANY